MAVTLTIAAGAYDLCFAAFHLAFWRLFGWPRSLKASGPLNSAVTQTLNLVLIYVFIAYGAAAILGGMQGWATAGLPAVGAGFWTLRTILQPLLFSMRESYSKLIAAIFAAGALLHVAAAASLI